MYINKKFTLVRIIKFKVFRFQISNILYKISFFLTKSNLKCLQFLKSLLNFLVFIFQILFLEILPLFCQIFFQKRNFFLKVRNLVFVNFFLKFQFVTFVLNLFVSENFLIFQFSSQLGF